MTPREAVLLVRYVKACCPQQQIDEYTPDAWHDLLGDLNLDDCREAARLVAQRQPFVSPSEIRAEVQRIRAERIGPPGPGLPPVPPPADPDNPRAYLAALRAQQRAIADGRAPRAELTTGDTTGGGYEDSPTARRVIAEFRARQQRAQERRAAERRAETEQLAAYRAAVETLLALPDHGAAALAAARDHLLGDEQAARGFPDLQATPGVMDEHKITIWAARIVTDGETP